MKYADYIKQFWPIYFLTLLLSLLITKGADQAVTTIAQNTPIPHENTIIIDAGHGGEDPGKVGVHQEKEKEINLTTLKSGKRDTKGTKIRV